MTVTDRAAWLEERRNGIGGSDVAGILGISRWSSPWSVYAEKVGLVPPSEANEAMEFGIRAEAMLADWFHDRTGLYVGAAQLVHVHPDEPWMRCTVDGLAYEGTSEDADPVAVVEFKTTGDPAEQWETDGVPTYYQTQAQWTMAVTGHQLVMFGVLHLAYGRPQFRVYELVRDEADIKYITAVCRRFWDDLCNGIPPDPDAHPATADALAQAYSDPDPDESVEATLLHRVIVGRIKSRKDELRRIEDEILLDENTLKAALGNATTLTYGVDGKGKPVPLVTWKAQDRRSIDAAALRAELPEVAARFEKTTSSRVLRIRNQKDN